MNKILRYLSVLLPFIGIIISGYLTWEHYGGIMLTCPAYFSFIDCGKVLDSRYSVLFNIPLALLGFIFYIIETWEAFLIFNRNNKNGRNLLILLSTGGFLFSLYLLYLQVIILRAVCIYCLGSAVISAVLLPILLVLFSEERLQIIRSVKSYCMGRASKK